MKRIFIVLAALVTVLAFVSVSSAAAAKPKTMKAMGTVVTYDKDNKALKIKGAKDKELDFTIADDAKVKGEIAENAKVTVSYKKEGDKMIAMAIAGPAAKKKKK